MPNACAGVSPTLSFMRQNVPPTCANALADRLLASRQSSPAIL
jgi:hypothetical protein